MNKGQRWMIGGALVAVLILVVGWFFVVSPVRSKTTDQKAQTADLDAANAQLQVKLNQLVTQNKSVTDKQAELSNIGAEVPSDPHLPQLIRSLSASAGDSGVDMVSLTPTAPSAPSSAGSSVTLGTTGTSSTTSAAGGSGAVTPTPHAASASYQTIAVALTLNGDYSGIEEFLQHLQTMKRIFVVNSIQLAPTGAATATGITAEQTPNGSAQTVHTLTVTLNGDVFMTDPSTTAISLPALNGTTSGTTSGNS